MRKLILPLLFLFVLSQDSLAFGRHRRGCGASTSGASFSGGCGASYSACGASYSGCGASYYPVQSSWYPIQNNWYPIQEAPRQVLPAPTSTGNMLPAYTQETNGQLRKIGMWDGQRLIPE